MEINFLKNEIISVVECKKINSQSLAFVGDGVYSLYIRTLLVENKDMETNKLHKYANQYVCANGQSCSITDIIPILTEDELDVFKRGRNYKTGNIAKHAKLSDYKKATGFEALLGFLFLTGQNNRLKEILNLAIKPIEVKEIKDIN